MTHTVDDLWRLFEQASRMPYGAGQIAATEQLIRHADAVGDPHLAFAARMLGTNAYVYGGEPAKSFVTFSWCLADFDRKPGPYHQRYVHNLFWHFKYMVNALLKFPEVPLDRTYAVLDDMERRYRDAGHSLHAVYSYRHHVARHIGAEEEAEEWYRKWIAAGRDDLSDCAGCDPSSQARHLAKTGRDEEAVALAEPVLAGRLSCVEQPQGILTTLLLPYLRTGRRDAARDAHRQAYRRLRGNLADMDSIAEHVEFCALTGNEARGLEIVERHLDWLDRAPSPSAAMDFAASAALVLRRLHDAGHGDLTIHRRAHGDRPAADVAVGILAAELAELATSLAARFDARNGTPAQSRRIEARLMAEPIGEYLPLSATARRSVVPRPRGKQARAMVPSAGGAGASSPAVPPVAADGTTAVVRDAAASRPDIPAGAAAVELLALAEKYELVEETEQVLAVLAEFDARFDEAELDAALVAARAEFRGHERYRTGDLDGAEVEWRRSAELYRSAGEPVRAWSVTGRLGVLRCMQGAAEEGIELVESSAEFLAEHGTPRQEAAAHARVGLALLTLERLPEALQAHERADRTLAAAFGEELDSEPGVAHLAARVALVRAQILGHMERPEEFLIAADAAREAYRRLGSAAGIAAAGVIYAQAVDDPAEAVEAYDEAVRAAGSDEVAVDAWLGRARALLAMERTAEAIDDFVEVIGICAERGIEDGAAFIRFELAHTYYRAGRNLEAAEAGEEALVGLIRIGAQVDADRCRHMLASIYMDLGEGDAALEMLDQLAANLDGPDNLPARGQVLEEAGDLLYRIDRDLLAAERFAAAMDAYRLAGLQLDQLRTARRQATALHWADEGPAAVEALERADEVSTGLAEEVASEPAAVWERAMLGYDAARILIGVDRLDDALSRITVVPAQFRSIEAFGEALQADLLVGEVLLRLDRAGEAEPVLRNALAALPRDSGAVRQAAWLLARALSDLGRSAEAEALATEYDLENDD
ncbi:MAG TPA: hypothetical protein VFX61_15615 [Micromonosporaceae bacterium]|nr:hypothetical protein [Micromonosporaceae bacterium]